MWWKKLNIPKEISTLLCEKKRKKASHTVHVLLEFDGVRTSRDPPNRAHLVKSYVFVFFFQIINWTWSKVFKCRSEIWIWVLWPLWVDSIVCTSSTITNLYSLGIHSKLCPNLYQFINIFFFIRVNNCTCTSLYVVNDYVMFVVYFRTVICKCVLQSWKYTGKTILCISSLN